MGRFAIFLLQIGRIATKNVAVLLPWLLDVIVKVIASFATGFSRFAK